MWIKKDTVPEFPAFVSEQTRDPQPQSQQQQLRIDQALPPNIPIRSTRTTRTTKSYENMDVEEETNTSTSKKGNRGYPKPDPQLVDWQLIVST